MIEPAVGEEPENELLIRSIRHNSKGEYFVTIPSWWLDLEEDIYSAKIKQVALRINEERILIVPLTPLKRNSTPPVQVNTEHAA